MSFRRRFYYGKAQDPNIIDFEDDLVKEILVANFDKDGDGEISYEEAKAVQSFGSIFRETKIKSFDELKYFTSVQNLDYTFYYCSWLNKITLPPNLRSIGDFAFYKCAQLKDIYIPFEVTNIGDYAFFFSDSIESVFMGGPVSHIGDYAFARCWDIKEIEIRFYMAPEVAEHTFGGDELEYTGRLSKKKGINKLRIRRDATGFDSGYWLDPLQNAEKCGFEIEFIN